MPFQRIVNQEKKFNQLNLQMEKVVLIITIVFLSISCKKNCYEVIRVKEIEYDISNLKKADRLNSENIISERKLITKMTTSRISSMLNFHTPVVILERKLLNGKPTGVL